MSHVAACPASAHGAILPNSRRHLNSSPAGTTPTLCRPSHRHQVWTAGQGNADGELRGSAEALGGDGMAEWAGYPCVRGGVHRDKRTG